MTDYNDKYTSQHKYWGMISHICNFTNVEGVWSEKGSEV